MGVITFNFCMFKNIYCLLSQESLSYRYEGSMGDGLYCNPADKDRCHMGHFMASSGSHFSPELDETISESSDEGSSSCAGTLTTKHSGQLILYCMRLG